MHRPFALVAITSSVLAALGAQAPSKETLWTFDRYLDYAEVTAHVRDLARRRPELVWLRSMGRSLQGRDIPIHKGSDPMSVGRFTGSRPTRGS